MPWVWVAWLLLIAMSFALLEGHAIRNNRMTLSRFVWTVSQKFPALPFFVGLLIGFLACHFWWGGIVHFDPVPAS